MTAAVIEQTRHLEAVESDAEISDNGRAVFWPTVFGDDGCSAEASVQDDGDRVRLLVDVPAGADGIGRPVPADFTEVFYTPDQAERIGNLMLAAAKWARDRGITR